jgi:hypothetical protein
VASPRALSACRLALIGGSLLLAVPPRLPADPPATAPAVAPDDVARQVRGWVKELASERYEVREKAREALERHGRQAPDVLKEFQDDPDPEIRRSVRDLLARGGKLVEAVPAEASDLKQVGRVTLRAEAEPLGRVLEALDEGFAVRVRVPEAARERPVTLALEGAACFEALERLAEAVDLAAPGPFDADGMLAFEPRQAGLVAAPAGSAGPVRVRATRVEASRPLGATGPTLHGLTLEVQVAPCVQLVSYRAPRVSSALDAEGRRWKPAGANDGQATYGVGGEARRVETRVLLERADAEADERLDRLELVLDLRLRHERRAVVFTGFEGLPRTLDLAGQPSEAGRRGSVTLERLAAAEGRSDAWTVEIACVLDGAPARASVEAWLELADGARRRLWISGGRSSASADGRLRLVGRVFGAGASPPRAVHVVWFERESMGELPVVLRDVPLR